jgi:hypothetical protein
MGIESATDLEFVMSITETIELEIVNGIGTEIGRGIENG